MARKDEAFEVLERLSVLRCPRCAGELQRFGDSLICAQGHTWNMNRRGYLNLLSRPVEGCYDRKLFEARRKVMDRGIYVSVLQAVQSCLTGRETRILDCGCGDGWYLQKLLKDQIACVGVGLDISADAIRCAVQRGGPCFYIVGDLKHLPFRSHAFDAVLDILTPADYASFAQVLHPEGRLIKVIPGRQYMREIRQARCLELYDDGPVTAYLREKCDVLREIHVLNSVKISGETWRDLVYMTPLNQDLSDAEKDEMASRPAEVITLDLRILACRIRSD